MQEWIDGHQDELKEKQKQKQHNTLSKLKASSEREKAHLVSQEPSDIMSTTLKCGAISFNMHSTNSLESPQNSKPPFSLIAFSMQGSLG